MMGSTSRGRVEGFAREASLPECARAFAGGGGVARGEQRAVEQVGERGRAAGGCAAGRGGRPAGAACAGRGCGGRPAAAAGAGPAPAGPPPAAAATPARSAACTAGRAATAGTCAARSAGAVSAPAGPASSASCARREEGRGDARRAEGGGWPGGGRRRCIKVYQDIRYVRYVRYQRQQRGRRRRGRRAVGGYRRARVREYDSHARYDDGKECVGIGEDGTAASRERAEARRRGCAAATWRGVVGR